MEADLELLSPAEAAKRLSLGKTKFYELLADGSIPSVRIGKMRRIPTRELKGYVDRLCAQQVGASGTDIAGASHTLTGAA
jgi:excisionase family DNA binding protein